MAIEDRKHMIRNYFNIAWRNLCKDKGYSALNVGGLALGMAAAMLILLWVQHEVGFDRFHTKADRLYIAGSRTEMNGGLAAGLVTPQPLGPALKSEVPGVVRTSRQLELGSSVLLTAGERKQLPTGYVVDSTFLTMFDLPLLEGDKANALDDPLDIVITRDLAERLFGNADALGRTIRLDTIALATVTGVLTDIPDNSRFRGIEYLVPYSFFEQLGYADDYWGSNSVTTYVELASNASETRASANLRDIARRNSKDVGDTEVFLHPLRDWWLRSVFENGKAAGGRIELVRMFGIIAVFILLIACINFMNLGTARSEKRAREVGVRKMAGAQRRTLVGQFLCESILVAALAGLLALGLVLLSLPAFNKLVGRQLAPDFGSAHFWLAFGGFTTFTGLLAGSYPAFFLSHFNPVAVLKGLYRRADGAVTPRRVLVVVQFTIAIILIVGTVAVHRQIQYGKAREHGYNGDNIIYLLETGEMADNIQLIRHELLEGGIAESVTRCLSPITESWSSTAGIDWPGKSNGDRTLFDRLFADEHVVRTMGLELTAGRDLDPAAYPTDSSAVLLNESAVRAMGLKEPLGQTIRDNGRDWHVVGVVKDFILGSPFSPITPTVIEGAHGFFNVLHIRLNPGLGTAEALRRTEEVLARHNPDYPFTYIFVDDAYAVKFAETQRTGTLAALFAGLTILISCVGLFGLAAYLAESRTKEIGVRKVLGASVLSIARLLSREFVVLVLLACLVAFPIAYWAADRFLRDFSYRIPLGWELFFLSGMGALALAIVTVSTQAIRAALANPVKSLRDE